MLAVLVVGNELAVLVGCILHSRHVGVGMTTEHQVAALSQTDELLVRIVRDFPTQMAQTDNEVTLLLIAQDIDVPLGRLCRIEVGDALAITVEYQALQFGSSCEYTNLHPLSLQRDIGFNQILEHCSRTVVVGADDREFGLPEKLGHVVKSEVELMVADGDSVVAHLVHQTHFDLTLEERIVTRALGEVATVEE